MAILFAEGWDCFSTGSGDFLLTGTGWSYSGGGMSVNTGNGRLSGGAVNHTQSSAYVSCSPTMARGDTVFIAAAYYAEAYGQFGNRILSVFSSTPGELFSLWATSTGVMWVVSQDGTIYPASKAVLTPRRWHWIEVSVTLGTTSGNGAFEVRVNGDTIITGASMDTDDGATPTTVRFYGADSYNRFDDVLIWNSAGSAPTSWLGDMRIDTLVPNGDGGVVDWTASAGSDYQCVDDTPSSSDDDGTYIDSTTSAQESRFTMGNLSGTSVSIPAVQPRVRARRDDTSNSKSYRDLINSSATEATGTTVTDPGTSYVTRRGSLYTTDPNTAAAWTDGGVNALEVGVEMI